MAEVHGKGDPDAELVRLEFAEIKEQVEYERKFGAKSYADLLEPNVMRRAFLGMSLQAWSQLTGMNIMMYYITYGASPNLLSFLQTNARKCSLEPA